MTLIVEDGTGLLDAESYTSVDEADTYHNNFGNANWSALDIGTKEINLRKATRYMVAMFRNGWQGWRTVRLQALDWPRAYVYRDEFDFVDVHTVPWEVKECCAELALIASVQALLPESIGRGKKQVKLGPLDIVYDGEGDQVLAFVNAVRRLVPLLDNGHNSTFSANLVRS